MLSDEQRNNLAEWDKKLPMTNPTTPPDWIKVVRMIRTERDWPMAMAVIEAGRMFAERAWVINPSFQSMIKYQSEKED